LPFQGHFPGYFRSGNALRHAHAQIVRSFFDQLAQKTLTGDGALVHNLSTLRLFPFHHPCELGITMAKKKKGAKAASRKSSKGKRSAKKKGAKKGAARKGAKRSAKKSARKPAKKASRASAPATPAPMSTGSPYSAPTSTGMGGTTEGGLGW
jgi:hypothetical protein